MQPLNNERETEDFERTLKAWGERPGKLSPAVAKTRVLAMLPSDRKSFSWRQTALAATMIAVLAVVVYWGAPGEQEGPIQLAQSAPITAKSNVVIMVLDAETTVYYILDSDTKTEGGVS